MLQNFEIAVSVKGPEQRTFRAELKFMHGDADGYSVEQLTFRTEEEVVDLLDLIDAYNAIPWNSRTKRELLRRLPHYMDIFSSNKYAQDADELITLEQLEAGWGEDYWPHDHRYDGYPARLDRLVKIEWNTPAGWIEIKRK